MEVQVLSSASEPPGGGFAFRQDFGCDPALASSARRRCRDHGEVETAPAAQEARRTERLAAWGLAGVLSVVIVAVDFTIAVFIFPFAAFATLWLAANVAGREALAFPVGVLVAAAYFLA